MTSANFCKPIHDIINYSTSIFPFESGKYGKEGKKLQKFEYLENKKSFWDEVKNIFHSFCRAIIWWKNKNLIKKWQTQALSMSWVHSRIFLERPQNVLCSTGLLAIRDLQTKCPAFEMLSFSDKWSWARTLTNIVIKF